MERLTQTVREDGGWEHIVPVKDTDDAWFEIIEKLSVYEDTGLDPEEVERVGETLITVQRLKGEQYDTLIKYLEAEAENRLVILPCRVGKDVFVIWYGNVVPAQVIGYQLHEWSDAASARVLFDTKKVHGMRDFSVDSFGKTVFLTREEAEAALKGVSNGKV